MTTETRMRYTERRNPHERIDPKSLDTDNKSPEARRLSKEWGENRDHEKLRVIITCGDARVLIPNPERTISMRSINLGGKKERNILESKGVGLIVAMAHYDGETFVNGETPEGCGGAAAKKKSVESNSHGATEGLQYYIENDIAHPDPIVNAFLTAYKLAKEMRVAKNQKNRIPILVAIQDHRSGKVLPIAVFNDNGVDKLSQDVDWMELANKFDKAKFYANGIPTLPESEISDERIKDYLDSNREYMAEMLRAYPDLRDIQEIQNPRIIAISSKLPSFRTRYPETAKYPNSVFRLHMPREKDGEKPMPIAPSAKKKIFEQIEYPVSHAIENFGKPGQAFSDTDRIIIETSDINVSKDLAADLVAQPYMKEWLKLDDHKIIVIQNKEGISNVIEFYTDQPKIPGLA